MSLFDPEHLGSRTHGHFRKLGYSCDEANEARLKARHSRHFAGIIVLMILLFVLPVAYAIGEKLFTKNTDIPSIVFAPAGIWFSMLCVFGIIRLFTRPQCSSCGKTMRKDVVMISPSYHCTVFVCERCRRYCDTYEVSG